jgi:hypothetical protein
MPQAMRTFAKASALITEAKDKILASSALPREQWHQIWSGAASYGAGSPATSSSGVSASSRGTIPHGKSAATA